MAISSVSVAQVDSLLATLQSASPSDSILSLKALTEYYLYNDTQAARDYFDQMNEAAHRTSDSSQIADAALMEGKLLAFEGNFEASKNRIKSIERYALRHQFSLDNVGNYLGNIYASLGNMDSAVYYYDLGMRHTADSVSKGIILSNMATIYEALGQSVKAVDANLRSIRMVENLPNGTKYLPGFYLNTGALYSNLNKHEESVRCYRESIKYARQAQMNYWEGFASINLAGKLEDQEAPRDSIMKYYTTAQRIFEKIEDPKMRALLWSRLGHYYLSLSETEEAFLYLQKAEALIDELQEVDRKALLIHDLAFLHHLQNDMSEALALARKLEELLSQKQNLTYQAEMHKTLSAIYESAGQPQAALKHLKKHQDVSDSVMDREYQNKISELEIAFQTEQKDREIESLSQQAQIQSLKISQRNTQIIGLAIVILVVILAGILWYQRRAFKHRQAVADLQQRMLRLQMNPHFIFNALAAIQHYILQNQMKESIKYLSMFGKLMRQILEHSREESITLEEEIDMLDNYIKIQKVRFKEQFTYTIEVDPNLDQSEIKLPPLFAQPFVENAIEHGLNDETNGQLWVRFLSTDGKLTIEVEDSGKGMSTAGQEADTDHRSMATQITLDRLGLLSQELKSRFSLNYTAGKTGKGTRVAMILPGM